VKYTDSFSPEPVAWSRYRQHLAALGLDEAATSALVKSGCSQVLRQVMITDSVQRRGLAPGLGTNGRVDAGLAVVLAREDDGTAKSVVATINQAVGPRIPTLFWSHRRLLAEAAKVDALHEWAKDMVTRYVLTDN